MKRGKPAVPQEPLGEDGKQTLTLRVMVLEEVSTLKAPPRCKHLHVRTTHTDTCIHTHTHISLHLYFCEDFHQHDVFPSLTPDPNPNPILTPTKS